MRCRQTEGKMDRKMDDLYIDIFIITYMKMDRRMHAVYERNTIYRQKDDVQSYLY